MNKPTLPIFLATFLLGSQAMAAENPLPRGRDIDPLAGNCKIGPFEQTSKAARYNELCSSMPDAEKCLALLKQSFSNVNGETEPAYEPQKLSYCLDLFRQELIRN